MITTISVKLPQYNDCMMCGLTKTLKQEAKEQFPSVQNCWTFFINTGLKEKNHLISASVSFQMETNGG